MLIELNTKFLIMKTRTDPKLIYIAHKIELKANNKFRTYCRKAFGVRRLSYNWGINKLKENIHNGIQGPVIALKKEFNAIKREQYPYVMEVSKYASAQAFVNLGQAVSKFSEDRGKKFVKFRFPKLKKRKKFGGSFYIGGDHVQIITGAQISKNLKNDSKKQYLKVPNFGPVQMRENLRFNGHICSVTISQNGNKIFAAFKIGITQEEYQRTHKIRDCEGTYLGIDLGLKNLITTNDGLIIDAPKNLRKNEKRIAHLQRKLDKKKHPRKKEDKKIFSKNFYKVSAELRKLHALVANKRNDYNQKISTVLASFYQYIAIESINLKGLLKNHCIAKSISDASFGKLKKLIKDKITHQGGTVVEADQFYPSSKTCSACGYIKNDLTLEDRTYICPKCGLKIDRDKNAAINLLHLISKQIIGLAEPKFKPADLEKVEKALSNNLIPHSRVDSGTK
ncbi:MAG: transposase [Succinatimonas sp.]|jgi:putative transposase|nr:transposase [Succinatimonas sp.]MDD5869198.1 transposase [Succinatimonas sp.]